MVTCIVQARMGSTRLKEKVIKEILGLPMIIITLKRLQKSKYIDKLILATSNQRDDDRLFEVVKDYGFEAFRGDEKNVLKRYVDCVKSYGGDIIVRVTGDCPLIDPVVLDNVVSNFILNNHDYVRLDVPNSFIRGFDVEVFSKEALMRTFSLAKEDRFTEHVTLYMYNHRQEFSIGYVEGEKLYNKDYRLCVDTIEDFTLVSKIFENFKDIYVSSKNVIEYLDKNPDIAKINQDIVQKQA